MMSTLVCNGGTPQLFLDEEFNGAMLAEAVNYYVLLGEESTIQDLNQLWANTNPDHRCRVTDRIGWVCRILFEPKDPESKDYYGCGGVCFYPPKTSWPMYPLAHSGSTYFVLAETCIVTAPPEQPMRYFEYCRPKSVFRKAKISVPTRRQALKDAAALRKSKAWADIRWDDKNGLHLEPATPEACKEAEKKLFDFIEKQAERIR